MSFAGVRTREAKSDQDRPRTARKKPWGHLSPIHTRRACPNRRRKCAPGHLRTPSCPQAAAPVGWPDESEDWTDVSSQLSRPARHTPPRSATRSAASAAQGQSCLLPTSPPTPPPSHPRKTMTRPKKEPRRSLTNGPPQTGFLRRFTGILLPPVSTGGAPLFHRFNRGCPFVPPIQPGVPDSGQ